MRVGGGEEAVPWRQGGSVPGMGALSCRRCARSLTRAPSRAEPDGAEPSRAGPGRAEPGRDGPSRAETGRAGRAAAAAHK